MRKAPVPSAVQPGQPFNPYDTHAAFCMFPDWLAPMPLSGHAKIVYCRLARYAHKSGRATPSYATIGAYVGLTERQAQRLCHELRDAGLIKIHRRKRSGTNQNQSSVFEFLYRPEMAATPVQKLSDHYEEEPTDIYVGKEAEPTDIYVVKPADIDVRVRNKYSRNKQQADLGVINSAGQPSAPPAATRDDSFKKTLQAIKARGFPTARLGEKWELGDRGARTSGFTDEQLAAVIGGQDFDMNGVKNPVWMILRAVDALTAEQGGGSVTFGPTLDAVRVAETQARNGMDEGRERLERYAKCGDGTIEKAAQRALQRVSQLDFPGLAVAA